MLTTRYYDLSTFLVPSWKGNSNYLIMLSKHVFWLILKLSKCETSPSITSHLKNPHTHKYSTRFLRRGGVLIHIVYISISSKIQNSKFKLENAKKSPLGLHGGMTYYFLTPKDIFCIKWKVGVCDVSVFVQKPNRQEWRFGWFGGAVWAATFKSLFQTKELA